MSINRRVFGAAITASGLSLLTLRAPLAQPTKPDGKPVHSTSGKRHEEHHEPAKPIVHNWDKINPDRRMPWGGAGLQIAQNGDWQFTGHLFNSQPLPCQVALMFGVLSSNGNLYTFEIIDVVNGGLSGGSQLLEWDKHGQRRELKSEWNNLVKRHDWTVESLMREEQIGMGGGTGNAINPQLLLANVQTRLNAVGPVIAVCT